MPFNPDQRGRDISLSSIYKEISYYQEGAYSHDKHWYNRLTGDESGQSERVEIADMMVMYCNKNLTTQTDRALSARPDEKFSAKAKEAANQFVSEFIDKELAGKAPLQKIAILSTLNFIVKHQKLAAEGSVRAVGDLAKSRLPATVPQILHLKNLSQAIETEKRKLKQEHRKGMGYKERFVEAVESFTRKFK